MRKCRGGKFGDDGAEILLLPLLLPWHNSACFRRRNCNFGASVNLNAQHTSARRLLHHPVCTVPTSLAQDVSLLLQNSDCVPGNMPTSRPRPHPPMTEWVMHGSKSHCVPHSTVGRKVARKLVKKEGAACMLPYHQEGEEYE